MSTRIPVHVLTGFLGSGKTTLLRTILADESFGDTALLINEFGEVGLDDQLLGDIDQETVLLSSGCVCCSIRGDLSEALLKLASQRQSGVIPPFTRVIIETTGLADPGPIAATIANDVKVRNQFVFGAVLTVVDTEHALNTRDYSETWADQIAAADALWFSKLDIVSETESEKVATAAQFVNPSASVLENASAVSLDNLFQQRQAQKASTFEIKNANTAIESSSPIFNTANLSDLKGGGHLEGINSFQIKLDQSIDWVTFGVWLSLILHRHGRELLRVKGLLKLNGVSDPVAIHGVQHTLFPPEHVTIKDPEGLDPYLIFITRGISENAMRSSIKKFLNELPARLDG